MAKNSVPPEMAGPRIELANDYHWVSSSWDHNPLPDYVKQRLLRADRCVMAASSLARVLHRFTMGTEDVKATGDGDDFQVVYPALDVNEADQLRIGLQELLWAAEGAIEEIRDNRQGYVTASMKEKARG